MGTQNTITQLAEIAGRIKEMREIMGWTVEEMAAKTEVTVEMYNEYEGGHIDLPFTFIHKCAAAFDIEITDKSQFDDKRVIAVADENGISTSMVEVSPIPQPDLWFENVWNEYMDRWSIK